MPVQTAPTRVRLPHRPPRPAPFRSEGGLPPFWWFLPSVTLGLAFWIGLAAFWLT